jgi:hypothetical protein
MQRILWQWAGIGILALIGFGVSIMPTITSWIPSIIIWILAFIWLVSTIIYWYNHRKIKDILTEYMSIANELILDKDINTYSDSEYTEKLKTWTNKVSSFISTKIGKTEEILFLDNSQLNQEYGLIEIGWTSRDMVARILNHRVAYLKELLKKL